MKFLQYIAFAVFLVAVVERTVSEEPMFETIHIRPQPKTYSMQIREFHECVSCNSNDGARRDFVKCLKGLSEENKMLVKSCCSEVFDGEFCGKASHGDIDFSLICNDPMKGIQVERCFWKKTDKTTDNIAELRKCKLDILNLYCTSKSEDK